MLLIDRNFVSEKENLITGSSVNRQVFSFCGAQLSNCGFFLEPNKVSKAQRLCIWGSCYSQSTTLQIDVCGAFVWVVEHNVLLSRCSVPFCRTEKACVLENYFILESLFCIVDETSIINGFFFVWRVVWCGVVARTVKLYLREVNQLTWMNWIAKAVKTKDTWKSSDLCGRKYRSLWIGLFCDGVCGVVWLPWQSNFIWGT